jgi:hypothetical protein
MVGFLGRGKGHAVIFRIVGESPSGKALASGASIRGFESLLPSHSASQATQNWL